MEADLKRDTAPWLCAALNIFMGLKVYGADNLMTVGEIVDGLTLDLSEEPNEEEALVHTELFHALKRMVKTSEILRSLVIDKQSCKMGYNTDGLNAAVFSGRPGRFVVFRCTGAGEWNDNAVALLGQTQPNAYYGYDRDGVPKTAELREEYVSTQQAQAQNYFLRVTTQLKWNTQNSIIVTGHSKGGNKAQFITLRSPLIKVCYSFCGQGFSQEAIEQFKQELGEKEYAARLEKMYSLSSYNDFVNVLGDRIIPDGHIFYLDTLDVAHTRYYHELAPVIGLDGEIMPQRARGEISLAAEKMWKEARKSSYRGAVGMAMMTMCEQYFGNGLPINGEFISGRTFYSGGRIAMGIAVKSLANMLLRSGVNVISNDDRARLSGYYDMLIRPRTESLKTSSFGRLVGRSLEKMRNRAPKEVDREEVHTGTDETRFSADINALRLSSGRIARVRKQLALLCVVAEKKNIEHAVAEIQKKDAALARCEAHLAETAAEFEQADSDLAALAGFVLR